MAELEDAPGLGPGARKGVGVRVPSLALPLTCTVVAYALASESLAALSATIFQRIGHASPTITMTIYQHVLPSDDVEAAAGDARVILGS